MKNGRCKPIYRSDAIASLLISHGAAVNAKTVGQLTPLHLAASEKNSQKVLEVLLAEPDADVNSLNGGGDSALELAARNSGLDSVLTARDRRLFRL